MTKVDLASPPTTRRTAVRWWLICSLLFLATTINYVDRQALSQLKPLLERALRWSEADYGWMGFGFQLAYAIMFVIAGGLIDRFGTRLGFAIAVLLWSAAAMGHALAASVVGFAIARFCLGIGEAANFPACIKTVAQWFPQQERALATGVFNAGSNVGLMLAPLVVWIATVWHWQAAFMITGSLGLLWVALWLGTYRSPEEHPAVSSAELAYIQQGRAQSRERRYIPWTTLLRFRQTWPFLIGKFLTDPVWWFFLAWMPSYLVKSRGLTTMGSAKLLIIAYVAADVGSVGGGWISSYLIKKGWGVGAARYYAMGLCAICMPGAIFAAYAGQTWQAIALISLALAAHQGWSANLFTTATDLFPANVTGSVVGLGGTAGAIGGMLMTLIVGGLLNWKNYYTPMFIWAGFMHPLSLVVYFLFVGRDMRKANVDAPRRGIVPSLLASASILTLVGLAGTAWIALHWDRVVAIVNGKSAAAAGLTAAAGVVVVGVLLIYASLKKHPAEVE